MSKRSSCLFLSNPASFCVSADPSEAGGPSRADVQALPSGGQERQRGSVIRGLPVSHAQGDPPASQLGPQTVTKVPPPQTKPRPLKDPPQRVKEPHQLKALPAVWQITLCLIERVREGGKLTRKGNV